MGVIRDLIFGTRDEQPVQRVMVGFPSDGGLISGGVTAQTTIGLSAVWRALDILSNGVSQLEWRERRGTLDLPLSRIVARPQSQRTRREWVSLVVSTLALYDVCYLLKVGGEDSEGVPMALWYLDPTIVTPATQNLFDIMFLLPPQQFFVAQQLVERDQLVILHRSPQPTVPDTAGGIIHLARTTFAAALAAERFASRYWQGGGVTNTVLETDQRLTPTQTQETSDLWAEKKARGPDYAPVLSGGLHAKSMGADPTTESAVTARRELVADIGRYFGIPTAILNAPTGDSETYRSNEMGNADLIRYTLQNYIGAIEDAITDQLPGGRRLVIDPRHLTRGTQLAQAQAYQLATGNLPWMSPAEVREETGLPPVEEPPATFDGVPGTSAAGLPGIGPDQKQLTGPPPMPVAPRPRDLVLEGAFDEAERMYEVARAAAGRPSVINNYVAPAAPANVQVDVAPPPAANVTIAEGAVQVAVEAPQVNIPRQEAPIVNVTVPEPKPRTRTVVRDKQDRIVGIEES